MRGLRDARATRNKTTHMRGRGWWLGTARGASMLAAAGGRAGLLRFGVVYGAAGSVGWWRWLPRSILLLRRLRAVVDAWVVFW